MTTESSTKTITEPAREIKVAREVGVVVVGELKSNLISQGVNIPH